MKEVGMEHKSIAIYRIRTSTDDVKVKVGRKGRTRKEL